MKKIIFLLLISVASYGQAVFDEGIQLSGNGPTTSTTKIMSQDANGFVNYLNALTLPVSTATQAAINAATIPDATATVRGKLKLAGDLGGTAGLPTTPTALHKTGSEIKNGALNISTSGGVAPLAPIHVGNRSISNSSNAQVLVSGNYNNSIVGNGHGFSDGSDLSKSGGWAYAAFDGRVDITGSSVNADHYVSFQHAPTYSFAGIMSKNWGLYTTVSIKSGTIDNNYGAFMANPLKSGTGSVGVNYGLYIENQTAGNSNYSIYSEGGRNYLGGDVVVAGMVSALNQGSNFRFKFNGTNNDGGVIAGSDGSLYFANWGLERGLKVKPNGNNEFLNGTVSAQPATLDTELATLGQLKAIAPASGTFTPSISSVFTPIKSYYSRIGNILTLQLNLNFTPTAINYVGTQTFTIPNGYTVKNISAGRIIGIGLLSSGSNAGTGSIIAKEHVDSNTIRIDFGSNAFNTSMVYNGSLTVQVEIN